ncbi:MAG TPA: TIGR01777 family oxidoreductase [Candidatus Methylomirabilis sp.]|nr:TIGR01777 family oxidoreductase [Candidatus Methylomirabilis sp.]
MKVVVSGSTGLIGSALVPLLSNAGHEVIRLVRRPSDRGQAVAAWDPEAGTLDRAALEGAGAVVHLAGEDIAGGRWTAAKKARIRDSRVQGTALLAGALASLARPPAVFAGASAVGYYGDRGDELLDEDSPPGAGFLAAVCRDWEAAAGPAAAAGARVLHLRFGVVLSAAGGALAKMLPAFRMGMGGPIGSGRQFVSWVAIDDAVRAIVHLLSAETARGPVNVVAPNPVTQADFARALGRVLGRPTVMPMPAFGARLMFGELADEALLASQRLAPARLAASGFSFRFPALEPALRHLVGSSPMGER